jgi:hypothetical protein
VQNPEKLSDNTTNKSIRVSYVTNLVPLVNVDAVQRGRKIQFLVDKSRMSIISYITLMNIQTASTFRYAQYCPFQTQIVACLTLS